MDTVVGFLSQQNSFKVKAVSQVQLLLALIATAWEPNLAGAVALLGLLASVLENHELLQMYLYFTPVSLVIDIAQILYLRPIGFGMWFGVMFLGLLAKVAGGYFAYLMLNAGPDDEAGYQSFGGGGHGTRSQRDPFSAGYQPPPQQSNPFVQPSGSPQRNGQNQSDNA